MRKTYLTYFMWGYQVHFMHTMEYRATNVLKELGVDLPLLGALVGVRAPDVTTRHDVCIVPEDEYLDPAIFASCRDRIEEIFNDHPDHSMMYGDEPSMHDKPENIRRKSVRQAVEEVFAGYDLNHETKSFCGSPTRFGDYYIVPVFLVPQNSLSCTPRLPSPIKFDRWTSTTSIVDALLYRVLAEASEALIKKEPGRFLDDFHADTPGLLRQAASDLCRAIWLVTQDFMLQEIYHDLNKISALRYEGGAASGSIVFVPPNYPSLDVQVNFIKPTSLHSHRLARKLVELSGDGLACVCEGGDGLSGLASIGPEDNTPVFRAIFSGHYKWTLRYGKIDLMECEFGIPSIPEPRLTESDFISNVRRIIRGLTLEQGHLLWGAVSAAMEQKHGTMLVISDDVAEEAKRLQNQSITIKPITLTPKLVKRISGIDGAVLVDRDCQCHSIGAILDGMATEAGDSSRGARFNSAVRYINSVGEATLCLVVSEDGYIDMVPTLRPQVDRDKLEVMVTLIKDQNSENYHQTRTWLDDHRFYLTPEQCAIVNAELKRIHSEPQEVGVIQIQTQSFKPHPEMNESYYLDFNE